jgi:hypothetical protein
MVAIFIFLLISMIFFYPFRIVGMVSEIKKKFKGNLMEWSKKTITLMSCLFEVLSIKLLRTYLGRDFLSDLFYLLLPQI